MVRRLKSRKRKYAGKRSFGRGNTKRGRGKGCRGGKGRAGAYKHKWFHTIKFEGTSKRNKGDKGFSNPTRKKLNSISLAQIEQRISSGELKAGEDGSYAIDLKKFKVLSSGQLKHKVSVKAAGFSKKARKKIEEAGGTAKTV